MPYLYQDLRLSGTPSPSVDFLWQHLGKDIIAQDVKNRADRVEVWASKFTDPGDDWVEFVFFIEETEIARHRCEGY